MLKHGILGLLSYCDRTGYEIMEVFKNSLSFMWNANTSQVYRELQNLKDSGFAEVTEVEQMGKPNKKGYSITEAGREELQHWVGDYESIKFPNFSILMRFFFGGMLPKEDAIAAIQKVKQTYSERGRELEQLLPHLDIYKADTKNEDYAMFWDMTLDFGRGYAMFVADWCDRCVEQIKNSKEEKV